MTISKITNAPKENALVEKVNEIIDSIGGSGGIVTSVNSKTGDVTLTATDVGALPDNTTIGSANLTIKKNNTAIGTFSANATEAVAVNITVPTKTSDLTNDDGFITGITSSDVTTALGYTPYNSSNPNGYQANVIETIKVNGTAQTVTSKTVNITIPSAVTESTVSGWGFTKNTGTVTSVNNVSPVNGNVSITIPTVPTIATSVSSSSTNAETVGAKLFYDTVGNIETALNTINSGSNS